MSGEICGTGLTPFCAIGRLHFYNPCAKPKWQVRRKTIDGEDISVEISRLEIAIEKAKERFEALASDEWDHEDILDRLYEKAKEEIFRGSDAAFSVESALDALFKELSQGTDPYVSLGSSLVAENAEYIITLLSEETENNRGKTIKGPVILIAGGITERELESIDRSRILGIVLPDAKPLSAEAQYAYSLGIPLIVNCDKEGIKKELEGVNAVIDGDKGVIITEPESEVIERYALRIGEIASRRLRKEDGFSKKLAIISGEKDIDSFFSENCDGIGLLCVEKLMNEVVLADEERLFAFFRSVCEGREGKEIRILMPCRKEYQRITLDAAMRASEYGKISLVIPSVMSGNEIQKIRCEVLSTESDLSAKLSLGAILKSGAAVMMREEIASVSDFVMVDCDSLYLSLLSPLKSDGIEKNIISENEEALVRALEMLTLACRKTDVDIGVCGILATRKKLQSRLIDMGIKEISVPVSYL